MNRSNHAQPDIEAGNRDAICIPRVYFDEVLTHATSYDELQILLAAIRLMMIAGSEPATIDEEAIMRDARLNAVLSTTATSQSSTSRIIRALNQSVVRGALVRSSRMEGNRQSIVYQLAGEGQPVADSESQLMDAFDGDSSAPLSPHNPQAASVYTAYEDNIGMLTPLVADQIRLALELYPASWVHEAIGEAVAYNRRQWRYIQRVLQNWSADGRITGPASEVNHEANRRGPARAIDSD
jgi:DNA replication protein